MNMKSLLMLLLVIASFASYGAQANDCRDKTFSEIFGALHAPRSEEIADAAASASARAADQMAEQPTDVSLAGSDNGGSTLNFLPFMSISGLSGAIDGESNDDANDQLGFDFNIPLPGSAEGLRQLKLAASFNRRPTAYTPLVESIDEDMRDAFRTDLEDGVDISDDATFSVVYAVDAGKLGRSRTAVGRLFGDTIASVASTEYQQAFDALTVQRDKIKIDDPAIAPKKVLDLPFKVAGGGTVLGRNAPEKVAALCAAAEAFSQASQELDRAVDTALADSGIDIVSKLANNQPQLHFGVDFRERDDVIGPDEISVKATFEWGYRANLNRLHDVIADPKCPADDVQGGCLMDAYSQYVSENKAAIDAGDRVSFSLEYQDIDDYAYSDVANGVAYSQDSSRKIIAKLGYGRTLAAATLGGGRLDLTLKYEDVDSDANVNDRAVGILTLTRKFGDIMVPFSVVYSNKPEFVEMESTDQLSAHLGIKYEFAATPK